MVRERVNGKETLNACAIVAIVAAYGIYMCFNPGTDGVLFGSVMLVIGALAGLKMKEYKDNGADRAER